MTKAEHRLEQLHRRKAELATRLADDKLYDGPPEKVTALRKEVGDIDKDLAAAEEAWLAAQATLEAAEAEAAA